ncbi:hypothetical protein [Lihuaxuella thermophila]|uniref:hypothetical protein n=1 Tax=Lihuaxuella thermophila TaxID=1173111 RepID=UPI000B7D2451|nr:hypothetical protein [Lihuaxuella thermophila]
MEEAVPIFLTEGLNRRGYSAEEVHGDLSQVRQDTVIRRSKEGMIERPAKKPGFCPSIAL